MIQIMIVDGQESWRKEIESILSAHDDFEIVGIAKSWYDAISLLFYENKVKPDVIIVDPLLPDADKYEIMTDLKIKAPQSAFVIFTAIYDDNFICDVVFKKNIKGYLLKEHDKNILVPSIRTVYSQDPVFNKKIVAYFFNLLVEFIINNNGKIHPVQHPQENFVNEQIIEYKVNFDASALTKMELRVLTYLATGYDEQNIAAMLSLAYGTVRNYVSSVKRKLGFNNQAQLIRFFIESGKSNANVIGFK
jgi:DNA-binding NarL/FixJ family response regulator